MNPTFGVDANGMPDQPTSANRFALSGSENSLTCPAPESLSGASFLILVGV